ncbi:hypothetical protein [Empedobacter sedimenti]|uniref:hypothetical protein n=1 Tax=Empedobacter sedimenti TaxID=3042610 RepID=UPI0024A6EF13|nr:hypothetical protein [Empedobacter sedimenti]
MKYINYFVYLTIVVALIPISLFYFSYKTKVGRIDKKEIIDQETSFEPCSSNIHEYYGSKAGYKTERYGIRKVISEPINQLKFPIFSGNINVRFVINCRNEIGYFRIKSVNKEYKKVEISPDLQKKIVAIIQQLNDWNGKNVNSYYQIQIKLKDGKVEGIF